MRATGKSKYWNLAAVDARYIRFCITRVNDAGPLFSIREIEVFNRPIEKPVIYLAGDAEMRHPYGKPFVDPGYSATGSDGGDVTGQVKVEGSVDVYQLGEQTLTYTLEGADSVTRTVTVYAEPLSITAADGMGCGKTLTASYANGAYDGATFQWSISATATGTYTPIDGETGAAYTIRETDMGQLHPRFRDIGQRERPDTKRLYVYLLQPCLRKRSDAELYAAGRP